MLVALHIRTDPSDKEKKERTHKTKHNKTSTENSLTRDRPHKSCPQRRPPRRDNPKKHAEHNEAGESVRQYAPEYEGSRCGEREHANRDAPWFEAVGEETGGETAECGGACGEGEMVRGRF